MKPLSMAELEAQLPVIRQAPRDHDMLELIVCRPSRGERKVLQEAQLDAAVGLVGDNWRERGGPLASGGSPNPDTQINIMSARVAALVAQTRERWPLAGDQLYLDLNLSADNLPPGTRLAIGTAILEVTAEPHNGCKKFTERFGLDAMKFVNSAVGKQLHLRGINAKVIQPGTIRTGDIARKLA